MDERSPSPTRWKAAPDHDTYPTVWWGSLLCWFHVAANGILILWFLGGMAIGLLRPSHIVYWPFAVGIPIAVILLFVVPFFGLVGQALTLRSPVLLPRVAGGAALGISLALWILLLTAPSPGI